MGKIISSYILPHPPLIVPEVGKGEENRASLTVNAVKRAAQDIKNDKPTTVIVTTPHAPIFEDYIYISVSESLYGDLGRFGSPDVRLSFTNNLELVNKIIEYANGEGIYSGGLDDSLIRKYRISKDLDHGALVPLYFINKELKASGEAGIKLVHISIAGLSFQELYRFGMCISKAVNESDERVVFVASGDLSHRLSHDGPYEYNKRGKEFDELLISSVKELEVERLFEIDEDFCESAGECGLRSFLIMFGALDGYDVRPEVYSYEGPLGVGYGVARMAVGETNPHRVVLEKIIKKNMEKIENIRNGEDPYVALARRTLEAYVKDRSVISPPEWLPEEITGNAAGTFVSIKKQGQLRGCIGTTGPTRKNIAEEIIYNAISSGTRDPRFQPVQRDELESLVYSVDVLNESEPIESIKELDVIKYGVIVKSGTRSGLLLPNLEGVDTPEKQVSIALQKAGIKPDERYTMERFEVIRHK